MYFHRHILPDKCYVLMWTGHQALDSVMPAKKDSPPSNATASGNELILFSDDMMRIADDGSRTC